MNTMKIAFGAGCFWHVEEDFRKLDGVKKTTVGYMGGKTKNPTYKDVCGDKTGHIETVLVEFYPGIITFTELLDKFFSIHNPTSKDKQGFDKGTQYRSAIFYYTDYQRLIAEDKLKQLEKSGKYSNPIVTVIKKATTFYPAEEYHQKYLMKSGKTTCEV